MDWSNVGKIRGNQGLSHIILGGPVNCPLNRTNPLNSRIATAQKDTEKSNELITILWSDVTIKLLLFYVFGVVLYVGLIDDRYN